MERKLNFWIIWVDMRRAICSGVLVGVAGVSMVMYIASLEGIAQRNTVFNICCMADCMECCSFLGVFRVSILCCFCEDFEQKWIFAD